MPAPDLPALFSLHSRHALVTGGGSGIGEHIAGALAAAGARVTLAGRRPQTLEKAAAAINQRGGAAAGMPADVTDLPAIAPFIEAVTARRGAIDILVNAAGDNPRLPYSAITPEQWRQLIDVNLSSAFFTAQAAAPGMAARGWGRILNIASLQSRLAFANGAPYGAGKGGIAQLTRAMAREWSGQGVNANAVAPGFFPTALTASVMEENPDSARALAARTAIGRNGELPDLTGAALLLCSAASDYITGQILFVDGGFTAV